MKKMCIYEPSMCCSSGLCGVGIDKELLRISTVRSDLARKGIKIGRYNLTNAPQKFLDNQEVNKLLKEKGVDILPITTLDDIVVKTGTYPTNDEIIQYLEIPAGFIEGVTKNKMPGFNINSGGCCG